MTETTRASSGIALAQSRPSADRGPKPDRATERSVVAFPARGGPLAVWIRRRGSTDQGQLERPEPGGNMLKNKLQVRERHRALRDGNGRDDGFGPQLCQSHRRPRNSGTACEPRTVQLYGSPSLGRSSSDAPFRSAEGAGRRSVPSPGADHIEAQEAPPSRWLRLRTLPRLGFRLRAHRPIPRVTSSALSTTKVSNEARYRQLGVRADLAGER